MMHLNRESVFPKFMKMQLITHFKHLINGTRKCCKIVELQKLTKTYEGYFFRKFFCGNRYEFSA